MPGMVMQMPGRHVSLSQPFLMDQIIQTPFNTIAPLCGTYIWTPKEHFCSRMLTLVDISWNMPPWEEPFLGTELHGSSRNPQKHNSCLFLPHHSDPAKALYSPVSHLRAADLHRKTDSSHKDAVRWPDKAHSVADGLYPHISQVTGTVTTHKRSTYWISLLILALWVSTAWSERACLNLNQMWNPF